MSEEQIKNTIRAFLAATQAKDNDKALSMLTEDVTWETPNGLFMGKAGVNRYFTWSNETIPDFTITETGIKAIALGKIGVIEHTFSGTTDGKKWQTPALCVYEFSGDKIKNMRTFYDRLDVAKQAAKGMMALGAVSAIIKAMEKGLR